jgi:adenine-specific DNA-methyltransferase
VVPEFKTEGDVRKDIKEGMTRQEIDVAILRHADTELLYDKPYEDSKRIRVTGPFTVESLSPHRVLPADTSGRRAQAAQLDAAGTSFETMILDNLRKAGVQNTVKNERLVFDRLEPVSGTWLHAGGTFMDSDGKSRRVAISIAPEHGTAGPTHVKEAAKEAVLGVGYDVLVCAASPSTHTYLRRRSDTANCKC